MGDLDIGLKICIGIAGVTVAGSAIVFPSRGQKDAAAVNLFDKTFNDCDGLEKRTAEFHAGHRRWRGFMEKGVYSWTRKLPGASTPLLNPYREKERARMSVKEKEKEVQQ